jgi:uncharacterized protein (TIGR03118 family)
MQRSVRHTVTLATCCVLMLLLSGAAMAQYTAKALVSNTKGKATYTDPLLANPWGLAYQPGEPFWVSDEDSGWSTLYSGTGEPQSLQVIVPPSSGTGAGTPTGIVYNGTSGEFVIDSWTSVFLFATLDGTIQGWSSFDPSTTLIAVRSSGSSYTGLAITSHSSGNMLYAADAANNKVDVYDASFNLVTSFTDSKAPAGFAPFGIQDISGQVYVTYAATNGGPGGLVDIFTESGTLVKRLIVGKPLNQPWGLAVAPSNFGTLSGTLLVTNNIGKGTINGFDLTTGKLVGTVSNSSGDPILINGIWGIEFGGGSTNNGATNALYFTAGPNDTAGYFGVINVAK